MREAIAYVALDQIDAANFDKLEIVWRFRTPDLH